MNLNELARIAPALLRSPTSRILEGPPGVGKTDFCNTLHQTMERMHGEPCGFARFMAATANPTDLMGYVRMLNRTFDGVEYSVSECTIPQWARTRDEHGRDGMGPPVWKYKHGIIIVEEYGQGGAEVKRMLANLFLEHGIGPHKLPDGWRVWATTNRAIDRSGVTKDYDFAINRRNRIVIVFDSKSLEDWMFKNGIHADFITFVQQNVAIFSNSVPEKQGPWATPRSVVMVEKDLRAMSADGFTLPVDAAATEIAAGTIGDGAAAQLMSCLRLGLEMPTYDDIKNNPSGAKLPTKPDAQYLVCNRLAAMVTADDAEPIIDYMQRMPKEFATIFVRSATLRQRQLIATKAFHNWCAKNAALVTVMAEIK